MPGRWCQNCRGPRCCHDPRLFQLLLYAPSYLILLLILKSGCRRQCLGVGAKTVETLGVEMTLGFFNSCLTADCSSFKTKSLHLDSLRKPIKTWFSRYYLAQIVKLEEMAPLATSWESLNSGGTYKFEVKKTTCNFSSYHLLLLTIFRPVLILMYLGKSLYFKSNILVWKQP